MVLVFYRYTLVKGTYISMDSYYLFHNVKSTYTKLKNIHLLLLMVFLMIVMRWLGYPKYYLLNHAIFVMLAILSVILNLNAQHLYINSYLSLARFSSKFEYEMMKAKCVIVNTLVFIVLMILFVEVNDLIYSLVLKKDYVFEVLTVMKYGLRIGSYSLFMQFLMILLKNYVVRTADNNVYTFISLLVSILLTQFNDFFLFFFKTSKTYFDFFVSHSYLEVSDIKSVLLLNVHYVILIILCIIVNLLLIRGLEYDVQN